MGEEFCRQARRFPEAILGGLQGKATQYAGKKTAQTVCNAYENGFLFIGKAGGLSGCRG